MYKHTFTKTLYKQAQKTLNQTDIYFAVKTIIVILTDEWSYNIMLLFVFPFLKRNKHAATK